MRYTNLVMKAKLTFVTKFRLCIKHKTRCAYASSNRRYHRHHHHRDNHKNHNHQLYNGNPYTGKTSIFIGILRRGPGA